jgi:hypothetical protein
MGIAKCAGKRLTVVDLHAGIVAVFLRISMRNKKKWKLLPIYPIVASGRTFFHG